MYSTAPANWARNELILNWGDHKDDKDNEDKVDIVMNKRDYDKDICIGMTILVNGGT